MSPSSHPSRKSSGAALVGVDVGGSALKLGALDPARTNGSPSDLEAAVLWEDSLPVEDGATTAQVFDALAEVLTRDLGGRSVQGLGLGLPGALNRATGVIEMSPNLPWLRSVNARDELASRLDGLAAERIHLSNDANAAALGEQRFGGGAGLENVLFVTLGTGVGSGLVLEGRLVTGEGLASEAGHLCVEPGGLPCGCGSRGCLETLASATAARRRALEAGLPASEPGNLERLTAEARAGAGPARELLLAVGRDLGHGLAHAVVLVDVRTFVFGGGFAAALDVMTPGILEGISERAYVHHPFRLLHAQLGNRAGWLGAAWLGA